MYLCSSKLATQPRQLRAQHNFPNSLPCLSCGFCCAVITVSLWLEKEFETEQGAPIWHSHHSLQTNVEILCISISIIYLKARHTHMRGMHIHKHLSYTHRVFELTGHQTMLRPARKNPPTVPRLVEYIAWKKRERKNDLIKFNQILSILGKLYTD